MINLLVAGDYCPQERVANMIESGDYSFIDFVRKYTANADYSIVNLECPVIENEQKAILKCGRNLKCTTKAIEALTYAGFNAVTLANNHLRDYGDEGVISTIKALNESSLEYVGGGHDIVESQKILFKTLKGKTLAIINFCESEFSIATKNSAGASPLDLVDNQKQISFGRKNADYVVVIVHGGNELYMLPNPQMQKIYRWFIENGADAVINHHQHCYSGYEIYKGRPVFYGLGNFCFDKSSQRNNKWNQGYIVNLCLDENISFNLIPYIQCSDAPSVNNMDKDQILQFESNIQRLNNIISTPGLIEHNYAEYCRSISQSTLSVFMPYTNRYFRWAAKKGVLPSCLSSRRVINLYDYINCDAHRVVVLDVLRSKITEYENSKNKKSTL